MKRFATRERNIPRAIVITLTLVAMIYIVVAITLIAVLGPEILAASDAPIALAVANIPWALPLAAIAAGLASLGALLAGLAGITRTALAMSRNKDLPGVFGHINARSSVPDYSLLLVGLAAIVLIVLGDIRTVIGFSSVGVLAYYLIANLAALNQDDAHRFVPKWLQWIGAALCTILIVTLPWQSIAAGLFVLAVGLLGRVMVLRHR
ncbi:APC family permease [Pseudoclavibacter albus]|uniref:APC family permease n=1 Tax=Pseudoclavibacter albus TaxID=272241 RepID=UPI0030B9434E